MKLNLTRFIAASLLVLTIGCDHGEEKMPVAPARPAAMVTVAAATARDVPIYLEEIGRTAGVEMVTVQPQLTGKLMAIHFKDGSDVKRGELLFTIDPRPFQAVLAQAEASVAQAEANVKWAQSEVQRFTEVQSSGAVARTEIEQKQNALAVAVAAQRAAEASVQRARLDLEYCKIHSPIDGLAGQHLIDVGNVVSAAGPDGGSKMLVIQRLTPIYADFTIREQDLAAVRARMQDNTLITQVWIPGQEQKLGEGKLTFLDNAVQSGGGTVKLRATLPNDDRHFWPGQFVKVRLVLEVKKDAVLVPTAAQQIGQQGPYVYVVKPDNTAELRPIKPGQRQGELVVVNDGVKAGEPVVIEGHSGIMPGAKVQVAQPPAATTKPTAVAEGTPKP